MGGAGQSLHESKSGRWLKKINSSQLAVMATFLDDSLSSPLDYDAEVAYITMTSPVGGNSAATIDEEDEFDFSLTSLAQVAKDAPASKDQTNPASGKPPSPSEELQPPAKVNSLQTAAARVKARPPLLSKLVIPRIEIMTSDTSRETSPGSEGSRQNSLSPLSLDGVPHFTLGTESPRTPTSQLRRIQQAQKEATPLSPSIKPKVKFQTGQHLYCTLVLYGSSGCGRTHLVNKLAQSDPSVFAKVVGSTTRRRRANEVSGVDFHFLSHKEMLRHISLGDFLEHVIVNKKRRETAPPQRQVPDPNTHLSTRQVPPQGSPQVSRSNTVTVSGARKPAVAVAGKGTLGAGKQYDSVFELLEEDSPVLGGEMFGTTHQALMEAVQQGKPCLLLNVGLRSANMLATGGLEASYVLIQSPTANKDKPPRVGRTLQPQLVISSASIDQAYSELHDYALQLAADLELPMTSNYEAAKHEWDTLPTIGFDQSDPPLYRKLAEVRFSELLVYFQSPSMKTHIERARAEFLRPRLLTRSKLSKKLMGERLMVQATSYCSLQDREGVHLRMLQTIYWKLSGNRLMCRRFGPHWQEIGFTGIDPADDLQEVGLLGPAQLIYFLDNPYTAQICKEIFKFCHMKDTQTTPFCSLAFSFSKFSLDVLEDGVLNKLCNKKAQVFAVINDFYMAAFHHYYHTWRTSRKTLLELGLLQHHCQDHCRSHASLIMKQFQELITAQMPEQTLHSQTPGTELLFTQMNDISNS